MKKRVSRIMLVLLLIGASTLALNIQPVRAEPGTIYIREDGSVDPPTAPIQRNGEIYTFTDDIHETIYLERSGITIDGQNHMLSASRGIESFKYAYPKWADYVTIKNILFKGCGEGIATNCVHGFIVCHNTFTENSVCISTMQDFSPQIFDNTMINNGAGIVITIGGYMTIYHNNFISSPCSLWTLLEYNYPNAWDNGYPSGGNYWSDYSGSDVNGDGIGETPYFIPSSSSPPGIDPTLNVDHYPLMTQWLGAMYMNYARLAEARTEAYAAYADIVYYYSAYKSQYYDKSLLENAITGVIPVLNSLSGLSAAEIAGDVAAQIKNTADTIKNFKDWLDSLQEPIRQVVEWIGPASAHAALTYDHLIELKNLCIQEKSDWENGNLGNVKNLLEQEKAATDDALNYAKGFRYYAHSKDNIAYEVADSTVDFLSEDSLEIVHLIARARAASDKKLITVELRCYADLHVYDPQGFHDGPLYDGDNQVIGADENIPESFYVGPETEPQFVAVLNPISGTYGIQITGRGSGSSSYLLSATLFNESGSIIGSQSYADSIVSGQTKTLTMSVSETSLTLSMSALPVGGKWVPIDELGLLAPWISSASLSLVIAASFVYVRRKRQQS